MPSVAEWIVSGIIVAMAVTGAVLIVLDAWDTGEDR